MNILVVGKPSPLLDAVRAVESDHTWRVLDPDQTTDDDAAWRAVRGVEALLHLGSVSDGSGHAAQELDTTTRGTYKVLKAATEAGIRRAVIASSLSSFAAYPDDVYLTEHWRPRPTDAPEQMLPYLREMVCREFARDCRIGITCLRFGQLVDADEVGRKAPSLDAVDLRDAAAPMQPFAGRICSRGDREDDRLCVPDGGSDIGECDKRRCEERIL